jgi:predicted nucleic acid-binding protein
VDANVLFSRVLRDDLMYAALDGIIALRWSDAILDELERNLILRRKISRENASRLRLLMTQALPTATIAPDQTEINLIADLSMPDHANRHVLAAAVAADAHVLCTANLRDIPAEATSAVGVEALSPDEFLHALVIALPVEMLRVHEITVASMLHSTDYATLAALTRAGAGNAAAALRALLRPR